jgi:hypothetical protein
MNLEFKARREDNVITFIACSLLKENMVAGRSSACLSNQAEWLMQRSADSYTRTKVASDYRSYEQNASADWGKGVQKTKLLLKSLKGRVIAQAVSRRLPTAAARFRAHVRSCGTCGKKKWHWGKYYPSTSVSSTNSHSTDCSTLIIYHPGLVQ